MHYTFHYAHTKHNWEDGRKNKWTNTGLGQLQLQERASLCDTFVQISVHLRAFAGVYFARNFHKVTRNDLWLSSLIASFCRPGPSLDSCHRPTVLFCLPLSTDSLCLLWDLSSLLHFRSYGRSHPQALCVDSLTGPNTNGNECYLLYHNLLLNRIRAYTHLCIRVYAFLHMRFFIEGSVCMELWLYITICTWLHSCVCLYWCLYE